jgi:hypothetical protein
MAIHLALGFNICIATTFSENNFETNDSDIIY